MRGREEIPVATSKLFLFAAVLFLLGGISMIVFTIINYEHIEEKPWTLNHCEFNPEYCCKEKKQCPYKCIVGDLIYLMNYKGKNYTCSISSIEADNLYVAETICNYMLAGNEGYTRTCYFHKSNIRSSLTINKNNLLNKAASSILATISMSVVCMLFSLMFLCFVNWKSLCPTLRYKTIYAEPEL